MNSKYINELIIEGQEEDIKELTEIFKSFFEANPLNSDVIKILPDFFYQWLKTLTNPAEIFNQQNKLITSGADEESVASRNESAFYIAVNNYDNKKIILKIKTPNQQLDLNSFYTPLSQKYKIKMSNTWVSFEDEKAGIDSSNRNTTKTKKLNSDKLNNFVKNNSIIGSGKVKEDELLEYAKKVLTTVNKIYKK